MCDELRETIRKLTMELETLRSSIHEDIPLKRAEALERYRIEYWNRLGKTPPTEADYSDNDGYDEIDGL